jgi:GTP-binding protein Era
MEPSFKAGFVCIVGKPNVGKSTLMNRLIGEKLSIVSPKPQTTRMSIKGILNMDNAQIVFLDTPGYLNPRYKLHEKMISYIQQSIKGADVILFTADASNFPTEYDTQVMELMQSTKNPKICVINKSDMLDLDEHKEHFASLHSCFDVVYTCSALQDKAFDELVKMIVDKLPQNPPMYNHEDLSDMPMRFFAQEIIREKIFLLYGKEIPYSSTVVIEKWVEHEDKDSVQANIWIERDSQKPIIIGKNGTMIAKLRESSEKDITKLTGRKVVLNIWVKVKRDWRKKHGALHEFGYH